MAIFQGMPISGMFTLCWKYRLTTKFVLQA